MTTTLIVGAGLGGLTAACQLAEHGGSVTIIEASGRAGGKAGSVVVNGRLRDHGWHGFPGWYVNTRALLGRLNVPLVGFDEALFLDPLPAGGLTRPSVTFLPTSSGAFLRLLRDGFLPPAHMLLYLYYLLDTMAASLDNAAMIDRISRTALMRGKWYVTDLLVTADSDSLLKGTAIPAYEMSAMTWRTVLANWARAPQPFMAVLPGDMQTTFIEPLLARARALGVTVIFNERVESFAAASGHVQSLTSVDAAGQRTTRTADYFLMGAPPEVARRIMGWELQRHDPDVGAFEHLRVIPMGSLHLTLKQRRSDVPRGPVFFKGGRYALSFLDMSQLTSPPPPTTVLSFVTSNSVELHDLSEDAQYKALMGEVTRYTGITPADVEHWDVLSNVEAPLAVNDVGAWPHRPEVRSRAFANLLYVGDWARHPVDLCCMEGAIYAAMHAAHEIGRDIGAAIPMPRVAPQYPRWVMKAVKFLVWPIVPPAYLWARWFED